MFFIFKFTNSNSLDLTVDLRSLTVNFPKQMAYVSHMFVIGLIYAIVAPAVNVIIFVTYLIAVGEFMHVVAGSVEGFFLVLNGRLDLWLMATEFFVPVLIGNILGGTALFAMIAYAQVMNEI